MVRFAKRINSLVDSSRNFRIIALVFCPGCQVIACQVQPATAN